RPHQIGAGIVAGHIVPEIAAVVVMGGDGAAHGDELDLLHVCVFIQPGWRRPPPPVPRPAARSGSPPAQSAGWRPGSASPSPAVPRPDRRTGCLPLPR